MPINQNLLCFTPFSHDIDNIEPPKAFTYVFYYQPHLLAEYATAELQQKLMAFHPLNNEQQGRMYGVLVVKDTQGQLGYLSALSGNNIDADKPTGKQINFVPPVFEGFDQNSYFYQKQAEVNKITAEITTLERQPQFITAQQLLQSETNAQQFQVSTLQKQLIENRKKRKAKREQLSHAEIAQTMSADNIKKASIELSRESVNDKKKLIALKEYWQQRVSDATQQVDIFTQAISSHKKSRKKLSSSLQKLLFKQYDFLNINKETKHLLELFADNVNPKPPAGSGDCAAPKLLQYAFSHNLTPICMAEFWWGNQPTSEIRKHAQFYPACQGKCQPILHHMLDGMTIDENPLLENPAKGKSLAIVYQDEHVVVVNKPAEFLSVPGKSIEDSVYARIKNMFPQATGSLIIHRLDMSTSGLMMLALNPRAHKHLQKQFINKEVNKRYVAVISGQVQEKSGKITLPLRGDINDRPRQLVCFEHGKRAETHWEVIEQSSNTTRLYLYPITGRTHQLRVHCAHPEGLNLPIIGDDLYGTKQNRLHLHAQRLRFTHPITQQPLSFEVEPDF